LGGPGGRGYGVGELVDVIVLATIVEAQSCCIGGGVAEIFGAVKCGQGFG